MRLLTMEAYFFTHLNTSIVYPPFVQEAKARRADELLVISSKSLRSVMAEKVTLEVKVRNLEGETKGLKSAVAELKGFKEGIIKVVQGDGMLVATISIPPNGGTANPPRPSQAVAAVSPAAAQAKPTAATPTAAKPTAAKPTAAVANKRPDTAEWTPASMRLLYDACQGGVPKTRDGLMNWKAVVKVDGLQGFTTTQANGKWHRAHDGKTSNPLEAAFVVEKVAIMVGDTEVQGTVVKYRMEKKTGEDGKETKVGIWSVKFPTHEDARVMSVQLLQAWRTYRKNHTADV